MSKVFNLSVVNIIPDAYREAVNQVAELYGCGDNNLSVKLRDSEGSIYWGCHSPWTVDDYALFSDEELRNLRVPVDLRESLNHLYERLSLDGNAQENWQAALTELNLITYTQEEV